MTVYLDSAATTRVDPRVAEVVLHWMTSEFGNAGSRTHDWGTRAKRCVQQAREQLAGQLNATASELIFTSGATESNNIALLGLAPHGENHARRHIISSTIEHKAVLEPLEHLASRGFEVDLISPGPLAE
ncbi:aminotransferase class V-fold PLP-dependent enzyme [Actinomadura luteofluorescens]|uniref:aminotransferase class V-fold PLP-dependent enzyme n=1 Tax=Actinomadura luteofluorescens TaxID=46163 RepID=UPI0036270A5A